MTPGQHPNPREQGINPNQPSNQGENLEKGTTATPDQSTQYEPSAELAKLLLSPEASERIRLKLESLLFEAELRDLLIKILEEKLKSPKISNEIREHLKNDLAQLGPDITELELGTMIRIAFKYIQLSELSETNNIQHIQLSKTDKDDLAQLVVKIADRYKAFVSTITRFTQFPYEMNKKVLNLHILNLVGSIVNVNRNSNDPIFRGRKQISPLLDSLKNALLSALYEAACTLLDRAAEAGHQELIGAISSLLEMAKELRPDEQKTILQYIKRYL